MEPMQLGAGGLSAIVKLAPAVLAPLTSPIRVELVTDPSQSRRVLSDYAAPPQATPWWVPGPTAEPPLDGLDADNLHVSIEDTAYQRHWIPVNQSRFVLRIYNKSNHAVSFTGVEAETEILRSRPESGRILLLDAGGGDVPTFYLNAQLYPKSGYSKVVELPRELLTATSYELGPRSSLNVIVDAGTLEFDEEPQILRWRFWFSFRTHRSIRRRVRFPVRKRKGFKMIIAPLHHPGIGKHTTYWVRSEDGQIMYRTGDGCL